MPIYTQNYVAPSSMQHLREIESRIIVANPFSTISKKNLLIEAPAAPADINLIDTIAEPNNNMEFVEDSENGDSLVVPFDGDFLLFGFISMHYLLANGTCLIDGIIDIYKNNEQIFDATCSLFGGNLGRTSGSYPKQLELKEGDKLHAKYSLLTSQDPVVIDEMGFSVSLVNKKQVSNAD